MIRFTHPFRSLGPAAVGFAALLASSASVVPRSAVAAPPPDPAARIGFDSAAVYDLIDTPRVLFASDGQAFADRAFAEIEARATPETQSRLRAVRELLRPSVQAFDPADAARAYRAATAAFERTLAPEPFALYSLGNLTESVLANASLLREEATDVDFRRAIGSASIGLGTGPGVAAARTKLAADAPDAWDAIATDAAALATELLGEPPPRLRPGPNEVWALLVRGRPIAGDGPRAGSTHLSLEVVYGDGRRRTFGAYPDGHYDFSATGGKLLCAFDREPASGPSRAFALVPSHEVSYDAVAERFANACNAFDRRRPAFRYLPQDDKHANDNAFVYGLLRAESLDVPQGL